MRHEAETERAYPLKKIQSEVFGLISNPLDSKQMMASTLRNGRATRQVAERFIAHNDRLSSSERIEIYNRQYWFRLIDCLYDDFPGLRALIGEKHFYDLTVAYLTKHRSTDFTLRNLGSNMVTFLKKEPRWLGRQAQVALEMAQFEWAQVVAFDGPELPLLVFDTLQGRDPKEIILHVQPYITPLALSYPLDDFVLALRKTESHRAEASAERARPIEKSKKVRGLPKRSPTFLVVHRFQNTLYYKRISKPAFILLTALMKGKSLHHACLAAGRTFSSKEIRADLPAKEIQQWFTTWSGLGWFGVPQSRIHKNATITARNRK